MRPHGNIVRGVWVRRKNIAQFGVHRDAVTRQIGQSAPDRRRSGIGQYADLDTVFLQQRLHPPVARAERICEKQHVFLAGILRDEVDALLEVLTDALVICRLRLALQPLDAVDAVRCGQSAVLRVVQVVGVRGQLYQTAVGHFGCLIPLEEKAVRFRVVVCADAFADQCNDGLHAGFLQDRVRNIVIGAITVVKGDHDRPLGHGFLSGPDVDQIRREQRRVAVVFQIFHVLLKPLAGDGHARHGGRVIRQVVVHQNRNLRGSICRAAADAGYKKCTCQSEKDQALPEFFHM